LLSCGLWREWEMRIVDTRWDEIRRANKEKGASVPIHLFLASLLLLAASSSSYFIRAINSVLPSVCCLVPMYSVEQHQHQQSSVIVISRYVLQKLFRKGTNHKPS
jgi:hypothetical protein